MPDNKILISTGTLSMEATLLEGPASSQFKNLLPLAGSANIWGDEIYFRIPVEGELESPKEVVEIGDLGYWPPGSAFCLFFGLTPASQCEEIRAAREVTVIGKIKGDSTILKRVSSGSSVIIQAV